MEIKREEILSQIKEKEEAINKLTTVIESLKDNRSRILGQISFLQELLKKDETQT